MEGTIPIAGPPTDRVRIAPLPDWVKHAPYDLPDEPGEEFTIGGLCTLLNETQVDLTGSERAWHVRRAEQVLTMAGAERAAQFSIVFDPTCEHVLIHNVTIRRGEKTFEHAKPDRFEVLRRERSLERLILDGRLTVSLITPDVRAGDVIEASYTIIGNHPIFGARYAAWIGFQWGEPVWETRHRLRTRPDRPLRLKAFNGPPEPTVTEQNGVIERSWQAKRLTAQENEPLTPPWLSTTPEIQFTEFATWQEVAELFAPLYAEDAPLPTDLAAEGDAIAEAFPDLGDRAAALLRFVQHSIRYLAISIGEGGLRPRPVAEVWDSRYGDCKDVTRVFVTLARRIGLDAVPALVNTREGQALDQWLASAAGFDHCIVRLTLDGSVYWMDATRAPQSGNLSALYQPDFGWALALTLENSDLERIGPYPPPLLSEAHEDMDLAGGPSAAARCTWRTTYRAWRADEVRETIRNEGAAMVARSYLRQLQQIWPAVTARDPLAIDDRPDTNAISLLERYDNPAAWRRVGKHRHEFVAQDFFVAPTLQPLPTGPRTQPIHLARPRTITRTIRLVLPPGWSGRPRELEAGDAHLRYACTVSQPNRSELIVSQRLDIFCDSMPAHAADTYLAVIDAIRESQIVISCRWQENVFLRLALFNWSAPLASVAGVGLMALRWIGIRA